MSYRLINANDLNGKISEKDYKVVLNAPCIYADLPNGLDNEYYEIPKWIPCEERLPEESKEYFVTVQHTGWNCEPTKFVSSSKYNPKTRCFECENEKRRGDKVIAWMPLPEPYKEGE